MNPENRVDQRRLSRVRPLRLLVFVSVVMVVAAIYLPGLSGPFIFDDTSNIVENPAIHMSSLDWDSVADAATAYGEGFPHRPVSTVSLALDYRLWGDGPFGYKVSNLLVHLITFALIFLLARQLFSLAGHRTGTRDGFWPALAVASLWAIHPLQVSTVLYVVQRMEMLAALFVVLSLLAYVAGRTRLQSGIAGGWWWIAAAGASSLLALFSKETGALAPFFMLAVELLVFRFSTASPQAARLLKIGFGAFVVGALLLYSLWMVPEFVFGDRFLKREFAWDERLLTQLRVLPMYLGWILLPAIDQYLFYYDHFQHSLGLFDPITTVLGGLLLVGVLAVAWLLRRRAPLVAFGIVWFFVAHALTSNLVSLELVFEHRNYLALFGVLIAVAGGIQSAGSWRAGWLAPVLSVALIVGLSALTSIRSATWGDEMTLGLHHVQVNPLSERAGLDMAELYLGNDDWSPAGTPFLTSAIKQLERVAKLPNARTTADQALIALAAQRDESTPDAAWNRLIRKVHQRALNAADYDAIYNLVQQRYLGLGIDDRRLWQLHAALCRRNDIPAQIHARFGYYAALVLEDNARATSAFLRAKEILESEQGDAAPLTQALEESGVSLIEGVKPCDNSMRLSGSALAKLRRLQSGRPQGVEHPSGT